MRSQPLLLKAAVIIFFALLLSVFVAYRSGVFDHWIYGRERKTISPDEITLLAPGIQDSLPLKDSAPLKAPVLISSSKSIIVADQQSYLPGPGKILARRLANDSAEKVHTGQFYIDTLMMPGSKSGYIIYPFEPHRKVTDTAGPPGTIPHFNRLPDSIRAIMYSSKSGIILRESDVQRRGGGKKDSIKK